MLNIQKFGDMLVLSASPYEHYNSPIKQAYNRTSKTIITQTDETVCLSGSKLKIRRTDAVFSAPEACERARIWGLFQARNTVSFPDVQKLVSTGGVIRGSSMVRFLSI